MSDTGWYVIENIVIICAMCFLVWFTGSNWWWLMLVICNWRREKEE